MEYKNDAKERSWKTSKERLNILGLSEVQWKESKDIISDEIRQACVAILLDRETEKRVTKIVLHSERLILVKLKAEPVDFVIIQVPYICQHQHMRIQKLRRTKNQLNV